VITSQFHLAIRLMIVLIDFHLYLQCCIITICINAYAR